MEHIKTEAELKTELEDQIALLKASVHSYDRGLTAEAKRMATSLRTLLKDKGRNSQSLLGQLKIKDIIKFHSVSEESFKEGYGIGVSVPEGRFIMGAGIGTTMSFGSEGVKVEYFPTLDEPKMRLEFDDWWNQYIYNGQDGKQLTRGELILHIAETDGGAHVDPTVKGAYADLSRHTGVGITTKVGGEDAKPFVGKIERVFMRQIVHELLGTFEEQLLDLTGIATVNHNRDLSKFRWWSDNRYAYIDWPSMRSSVSNIQTEEAAFLKTITEQNLSDERYRHKHHIMLRTGCFDQNGIEIYEGDIVQFRVPSLGDTADGTYSEEKKESFGYIDSNPLKKDFILVYMDGPVALKQEESVSVNTIVGNFFEEQIWLTRFKNLGLLSRYTLP